MSTHRHLTVVPPAPHCTASGKKFTLLSGLALFLPLLTKLQQVRWTKKALSYLIHCTAPPQQCSHPHREAEVSHTNIGTTWHNFSSPNDCRSSKSRTPLSPPSRPSNPSFCPPSPNFTLRSPVPVDRNSKFPLYQLVSYPDGAYLY